MDGMICNQCGSIKFKYANNGSIIVAFALFCFFIVPGLIYVLWMLSSQHKICAQCGNKNRIPIKSPMGQMFINQLNNLNKKTE